MLGGLEHEAGAGRLPRPVAAGAATRVDDEAEARERTEVVRGRRGADADRLADHGRGRGAVEAEPLEDLEPHRVGERPQCPGIADDDISDSH